MLYIICKNLVRQEGMMGFYTIARFECGVKLFVYVSTEIWLIFPNWEEKKIYFISLPICFGCKFKSLMLLVVVVALAMNTITSH